MADGLLGNIRKGISGLLGNEFVQGAASAAAFGANPLLGLLAGPTIKSGRERRERRNELERRNLSAQRRLPGLLADRTSVEQPGMGLLNLDGSVQELPGKRQSVPTVSTQAGNAELMGLLSDIAPQTAVQGLISQQGRQSKPSALQEKLSLLSETGLLTEEGILNITGAANPGAAMESLLATVQLQQAQLELQNAQSDRDREEAESGVERATFSNNLNRTIKNLFELSDVNDQLEGVTLGGTGFGAETRAQLGGAVALGADFLQADEFSAEVESNLNASQRFDTLANEILLDSLDTGNFDARTDTKFKAFASTKPDKGQGTRANALAIADKFEAALLAADANGEPISPERRAEVLNKVKQLRETGLTPTQIFEMPRADFLELDPSDFEAFTDEQKQAIDLKLKQLGL